MGSGVGAFIRSSQKTEKQRDREARQILTRHFPICAPHIINIFMIMLIHGFFIKI